MGLEVAEGKKRRIGKDPTVETAFLPDREREEEEKKQIEQLKKEWEEEQERIKREIFFHPHFVPCFNSRFTVDLLEVTYSYWDGTGHRRSIQVKLTCDCVLFSISFKVF